MDPIVSVAGSCQNNHVYLSYSELLGDSQERRLQHMVLPKDSFQIDLQNRVVESWRGHLNNIQESPDILEKGITDAAGMTEICTDEWCMATEQVIDDLSNDLFSINEPRGGVR
jgi:hypothetical protein